MQIDTLSESPGDPEPGAKALKAQNLDLRARTTGSAAVAATATAWKAWSSPTWRSRSTSPPPASPGPSSPAAWRITSAAPCSTTRSCRWRELVTNSLLHSGAPEGGDVVVRVHLWRGLCRVEVEDAGCEGVVAPLAADPAAGSGMGLNLVQILSGAWGVIRRGSEGPTCVWAQLVTA